jgi:serine/threonine-protein kinase
MTVESEEAGLTDLLIRWEELRERGESIPVEELCAGHSELVDALRHRIDALKAMATLIGSTVPRPDADGGAAPVPPPPRQSATCVAEYREFRFHAEGGLGEVFVAHGEDLNRDVAMKFIKAQRVHDPDCQRRFFQEAEITGRLEHPGIVPVYSLGHDGDGSPCYAMRFIRGRTLEDAIQEFHGAGGPGPAGRPHQLRGLIKRLVAVCNTIAYAHSRGVLHRDLKPKNIMLDKYDETLVVDWGLARPFGRSEADRALGEQTLTPSSGNSGSGSPTAGVVGTPAYMSPEQADGRWDLVGPPSDVYSLGATLYVLLTGRAPFEGRHLGEVLDRVRRGEFPPPRQVRPRVPGPLDAVCRKSMALKIEDRYPTALALAEDLERWLADEPVTAYRDPLAVRLARWGRRHRTAAVSATALLVMAAAAMTVTTVLVERQKREVVRQKTLAEVNYRYARDAVDQMLTKVGEVDLADVPQMEPVRRKLLEEARRFYLAFLGQRGDDPATRLEAGRAHRRLGDIQEMLGDHVGAEQSYRQALGLHRPLGEESPAEPAFRQDLASDLSRIGVVLKKANRFQEAERALRAALDLRVQLAAEAPDGLDRRQALADALYQWGALMARLPGKRREDEQAYREALALQQQLVEDSRASPEFLREKARYLNNLGMLLEGDGRLDQAEDAYREALEIQEALLEREPTVPGHRWHLARTSNNLGVLLLAEGRLPDAEAAARKALKLQEALAAEFPDVPAYAQELVAAQDNLGLILQARAPGEAEREYRKALKRLESLAARWTNMPDIPYQMAITNLNLAFLLEPSDPAEAERTYHQALEIQDRLVARFPDVPEYECALGRTLHDLSFLLCSRTDFRGARRLLDQAIRHLRAALEANPRNAAYHEYLGDSLGLFAKTLVQLGEHGEAAEAAEQVPGVRPEALEQHLRAAALLTKCVGLASADRHLADAKRRDLEKKYAYRAVKILRSAVQQGLLKDVRGLDQEDFDPLRERDDFKALRETLETRAKVGVG